MNLELMQLKLKVSLEEQKIDNEEAWKEDEALLNRLNDEESIAYANMMYDHFEACEKELIRTKNKFRLYVSNRSKKDKFENLVKKFDLSEEKLEALKNAMMNPPKDLLTMKAYQPDYSVLMKGKG
jgi:predicted nuclease with TOPRIM domain